MKKSINGNGFKVLAKKAKLRLLKMHYESGVGHIGGNLSCLDALLCLHHNIMDDKDLFILSKGHAAGALYVTLWTRGLLSDVDLESFHKDGTKLSGHPAPNWMPEMPIATGSLGHGFPVSCGIALAKKLKGDSGRVYCLTSDGEWQEGSNWEALIFAARHLLDNLTIIIDRNGLQGFGSTLEVGGIEITPELFSPFNVKAIVAKGHDPQDIGSSLTMEAEVPLVVILDTVKGKGVSFMENRLEWHYLPLTDELYARATKEVESE